MREIAIGVAFLLGILLVVWAVLSFIIRTNNTCPACGSRNSGSFDDINSSKIFHNRKCKDCNHTWATEI